MDENPETILLGRFTMACRDSSTGKAKKVPQLVTEGEDEKRLESMGKEQRAKKMSLLKTNLQNTPPNDEESAMLHNVFTKYAKYYQPGASVPEEIVWMKKGTQLSSILMCHPQERNVHGKRFVSHCRNTELSCYPI
jgi:acyl-coenzyme A thioesterase 9